MSLSSPIREEYEITLEPFTQEDLARDIPLAQRIWQVSWVRKSVILIVLAVIWEIATRLQNNDLLLPSFLQTAHAFVDGIVTGELLAKVWISLTVLIKGYLIGIVLAFGLTTLAVSTQLGRDLLATLTAMLNPLPAIALLPLSLLWFGLGENSLIFVLVHGAVGVGAQYLRGFSGRLGNPAHGRSQLRFKGPAFCLVHPDPGDAAIDSRGPENRLGVCLADLDRRRAGVWRLVR